MRESLLRRCGSSLKSRNIGRFDTIRTNLEAGSHTISCQLLEETADPGGGHEFRMISIMRCERSLDTMCND